MESPSCKAAVYKPGERPRLDPRSPASVWNYEKIVSLLSHPVPLWYFVMTTPVSSTWRSGCSGKAGKPGLLVCQGWHRRQTQSSRVGCVWPKAPHFRPGQNRSFHLV